MTPSSVLIGEKIPSFLRRLFVPSLLKKSRLTNRKINPNRTSLSHVDVRFEIRLSWTCACNVRIRILFFWRIVIMTKLVSPRARFTSAPNFLN